MLKDRFDTPPETDEPHQNDVDHDHDELYDDDQFYKEPEAIPPEPKLQGDLAKAREADIIPSIITVQSSSVRPPLRNRDDSSLEGEWGRGKGFAMGNVLASLGLWNMQIIEEKGSWELILPWMQTKKISSLKYTPDGIFPAMKTESLLFSLSRQMKFIAT